MGYVVIDVAELHDLKRNPLHGTCTLLKKSPISAPLPETVHFQAEREGFEPSVPGIPSTTV